MDLSIIIPVYNEEQILEKSLREVISFFSSFSSKNLIWELIVVNDGSTDGTKEILEKFNMRNPQFKSIHIDRNRGKGAAVREGFLKSHGDYLLFFDVDLSTPLFEFPKFWSKKSERTVLIGSRVAGGALILRHQRFMKEMCGRAANVLVRAVLPLPFRDTQCGFKLYPAAIRPFLAAAHIDGAGFDLEWLVIATRNGCVIEEMPVTWTNREDSRFGLISYPRTLIEFGMIVITDKIKRRYARPSI